MSRQRIWRRDSDNWLFHDECFEEGETRDGFTAVKSLDDLEEDASCASCEGIFLLGVTEAGVGVDEDEDDDN